MKVVFYVSKRNMCVYMGLDKAVFSFMNYVQIIAQIKFFDENLVGKFNVNYSQLIHATKWKFDYLAARKKQS